MGKAPRVSQQGEEVGVGWKKTGTTDEETRASERASERKGRKEGEGRREREKKDAHGCRWETNDRRPTEDTSKLLHGVAVPPLFTCVSPPHSRV